MNLPEGGPLLLLPLPALAHEIAHLPRTPERVRQAGAGATAAASAAAAARRLAAPLLVEEREVRDDFVVGKRLERLRAGVGQNLPERHAEGPHVALRGELSLEFRWRLTTEDRQMSQDKMPHHQDGFPGHPTNGEKAAGLAFEVVGSVTGPTHPEVGNFDGFAASNQTIPAIDISLLEHSIS